MIKCAHCGRDIPETDALKHKTSDGDYEVICKSCFQAATGVDYQTFAFRRENAKMTLLAVLFCFRRKRGSLRHTRPGADGARLPLRLEKEIML